ncbi:MAG: type IV pilus biogenesis/stability protein PilW [Betaproteobacteria bacterium]|nr:type IV pilus biogenesis/stability protein PilW [Betaproteobacteria bacterium]
MNRLTCATLCALAFLCSGCDSMPSKDSAGPVVESVSMTGEPGDPRNRAKVHAELAALYYTRGNMAIALEELRIAAAADKNYPLTYSLFGLVYMELREPKLAQANFERGLRLSPTDPDINHNYGWFLCQSGREGEAIKYFMQAVSNPLYPTPWRSYSAAGICSLRKNNLKEAEDFFQRALRQEPDDPSSLFQLGQIRYRQGGLEEARKLVSRYNRIVEPTAESLWLALRVERKLGERGAESSYANQLRRRFAASREYQQLQRGEYD